jgi:hypothetical protein
MMPQSQNPLQIVRKLQSSTHTRDQHQTDLGVPETAREPPSAAAVPVNLVSPNDGAPLAGA